MADKSPAAPAPIMPYYWGGPPPTAYDEQKADKPTPIKQTHFREHLRDWLAVTAIGSAFIKFAWIFYAAGSPATHTAIMVCVSLAAIIPGFLVLFSFIPDSKIRLKGTGLRWAFQVCVGAATALLIHYVLFG